MPNIVIISGVDKTGKDTIKDLIVKKTKGETLVIVRAFIDQIVYSKIYNRDINYGFFIEKAREFQAIGVQTVFLSCDPKELEYRFLVHNETDLEKKDIMFHQSVFDETVAMFRKEGITIHDADTTIFSPEETADYIINKLGL